MILRNSYYYFKSAISEKKCDEIIARGEEEMRKTEEKLGENATNAITLGNTQKGGASSGKISQNDLDAKDIIDRGIKEKDLYVRDTKVSWLEDSWLAELFHPFVHEANTIAGWNFDWDCSEQLQYTKYGLNQFYGWHMDCSSPYKYIDPNDPFSSFKSEPIRPNGLITNNKDTSFTGVNKPLFDGKTRKLSMTCNLSKPGDYEGGNLRFDFGQSVTPRYFTCTEIRPRGSIIVFPSHIYHQVTPVTKGTRLSLVMWCCGYPFK